MLRRVHVAPVPIEAYREIAPTAQIEELLALAQMLRGVRIAHINATSYGGGVSELLRSAIALQRGLGLSVDWLVISGDERFFEVTKSLHNGLQGASFVASVEYEEIYEVNNRANAATLPCDYDVIVVHDPQPAALRAFAHDTSSRWIWRCHIDTSEPDPAAESFLRRWLDAYDAYVFTMPEFVLPALRDRAVVTFPPGIDPLSPKNLPLAATLRRRIIGWHGVDPERPLLVQVSRYDSWKDPLGVIRIFRRVREHVAGLQLALIGSMALDDPEGWRLYDWVRKEAEHDNDILVGTNLTGISFVEVNAFQHCAWVVIQKSIREGFGLVVSEALWKETPVVAGRSGGITLQMEDGEGGFLVPPHDEDAFVECVVRLLSDRELARTLGQRGRQRVRERFLITRYLVDELRLVAGILQAVSAARERVDEQHGRDA
ncbi:MAG: glycosyltransferase [Thermomicrobium sp.]|nr:glycosyltransferase [Thermomicrobium sp.]